MGIWKYGLGVVSEAGGAGNEALSSLGRDRGYTGLLPSLISGAAAALRSQRPCLARASPCCEAAEDAPHLAGVGRKCARPGPQHLDSRVLCRPQGRRLQQGGSETSAPTSG